MPTRPMQVWNGTAWEDIGPQAPATAIVVQSSTPTGDSGKLWIDTSADVPTYANMAPTASPSFTGTSTFAGPVTMSGGAVNMSGATSVTGGGMDLITPTSVAGSGVTLSGGAVSFSAATTVSVNGCFTSAYENYVVEFAPTASASSNDLNMRLRLSGSDATGATDYVMQRTIAYSASTAVQQASTSTWLFGRVSTNKSPHTVRLYAPQLAQQTGMNSIGGASDSLYTSMGYHALATAYDGFTLYPGSSSLNGTLRVYGLRNS